MPAPAQATFSVAALIAAQTSFRNLIDSGAGAGYLNIRSSTDVLLAQVPFLDPCGTVSATTGQLTMLLNGRDDAADATGTAAYGELCDSGGVVHLTLPAQAGFAATPGKLIISTASIVMGDPVEVISATVG